MWSPPQVPAPLGPRAAAWALGLRVTRPGGERLDFGKALVRELVARRLLGLIPLYSVLDLLRPLTNDPRRAIHDSLANTLVARS